MADDNKAGEQLRNSLRKKQISSSNKNNEDSNISKKNALERLKNLKFNLKPTISLERSAWFLFFIHSFLPFLKTEKLLFQNQNAFVYLGFTFNYLFIHKEVFFFNIRSL